MIFSSSDFKQYIYFVNVWRSFFSPLHDPIPRREDDPLTIFIILINIGVDIMKPRLDHEVTKGTHA